MVSVTRVSGCESVHFVDQYSTNNKNAEADIGVKPEVQKSKISQSTSLKPSSEKKELVTVSSCLIFLFMAGIKGVHHYRATSVANYCGC